MLPKKILFLTPNGGRGGSEMMLWYLTKELDKQKIDWKVITFGKGDLLNEKNYPGKVYLLPSKKGRKSEIISKINRNILKREIDDNFILKIHKSFNPDLWYFNSCVTIGKSHLTKRVNVKFAVHFHELISVLDQLNGNDLKYAINNAYMNIGCSTPVVKMLSTLKATNVKLFHSGVDLSKIIYTDNYTKLRTKYNLKENDFLWIMSGQTNPRKGFDLFSEIAENFNSVENVKFMWIGNTRKHGYNYYVNQKLNELENVIITGQLSNDYFNHLNLANGFLLTSREDPFPLVMIESAYLGKPIVSFNSGGASEFILEEMGLVQNDFSISGIVSKMELVMDKKVKLNKEKSINRAMEFDLNNSAKNWINLL